VAPSYRELPPPPGPGTHVACSWVSHDRAVPVLPDACADILGERQLRRRFERAVGYGPATLVRIHRFQGFLALAERQPGAKLGRLAAEAGYADQAHLSRECRRLSGLSPAGLLAAGATAAGEKSDPFKPRGAAFATLAA
jgi:methylphosphotriester-DNA--protein-cysteine methyltransferase